MPAPGASGISIPDLARWWQQGDAVSHAVLYVLLAMSLVSWFIIFSKSLSSWRVRRAAPALDQFWQAPTLSDGVAMLRVADSENVYAALPAAGMAHAPVAASLAGAVTQKEQMTRVLRQQIQQATERVESGLALLASVGATAPFVGLLGTVWSIHHALGSVAQAGEPGLDRLAGPVGEALVMTGAGLLVAIPAVLAYNAFNRINRLTLAELDGFAHDLLAYFTREEAA